MRCERWWSKRASLISKPGWVSWKSWSVGDVLTQPHQGGIVFDSDPYDEWMETINKLGGRAQLDSVVCLLMNKTTGANMHCITTAEQKHMDEQADDGEDGEAASRSTGGARAHVSLAA